jgi:hypothetical protein
VAKLKYELWTDKPVARLDDHGPDVDAWNDLIGEVGLQPRVGQWRAPERSCLLLF